MTSFSENWRRRIPASLYTDEAHFAREREMFARTWLNVARIEEMPEPGDYLALAIPGLDARIVVARGEDGHLSSFHNACSHRGAPVCPLGAGNTKAFVCPFHAWSYGLDGAVKTIPDAEGYGPIDRSALGLTPVALDVWEGFVFVNLDPMPPVSLADYLGELGASLAGYPFEAFSGTRYHIEIELAANWKTIRDSFVESHHVRTIHRRTLKSSFVTRENPFSHAIAIEPMGIHGRLSLAGNPKFEPTELERAIARRGHRRSPEFERPKGLNSHGDDAWVMDVNVVFPNFFVDPFADTYLTYHFWPLAVDRTLWTIDSYFPRAETASQRVFQESLLVRNRDALLEDVKVIEDINRSFQSGGTKELVLHDEEFLISHLHDAADRLMGGRHAAI